MPKALYLDRLIGGLAQWHGGDERDQNTGN